MRPSRAGPPLVNKRIRDIYRPGVYTYAGSRRGTRRTRPRGSDRNPCACGSQPGSQERTHTQSPGVINASLTPRPTLSHSAAPAQILKLASTAIRCTRHYSDVAIVRITTRHQKWHAMPCAMRAGRCLWARACPRGCHRRKCGHRMTRSPRPTPCGAGCRR